MKKTLLRLACLLMTLLLMSTAMLTGCNGSKKDEQTPSTAQETSEGGQTKQETLQEETEKEWEIAPFQELQPDYLKGYPALTDEFTYSQSPSSEKRELVGNMYKTGFPIVKEKVTLKLFAPQVQLTQDLATNYFFTRYEEKSNVHIEWTTAPESDLETKRNLVLASGDLPDAFLGCSFSARDEMLYGDQEKLLLPLNDLIKDYGVWLNKFFSMKPSLKASITTPSGSIYSLPDFYTNLYVQYPQKAWVRQSWLDKLGMKVPTTTDELVELLKAIKSTDINGNGKKDEIGFVGSKNGWFQDVRGYLISPFILNVRDGKGPNAFDQLVVENGKVNCVLNRPEYKEALQWMHSLAKDGLLELNSFVWERAQVRTMGDNTDNPVIGIGAGASAIGNLTTKMEIESDYVMLPPLKGPSGNSFSLYSPQQFSGGMMVITSNCKTPEVAMRWADWLYSPEGFMAHYFGKIGEDWEYAKEGMMNTLGNRQAIYHPLKYPDEPQNNYVYGFTIPGGNLVEEELWADINPGEPNLYNKKQVEGTKQLYIGHEMPEIFPCNVYIDPKYADEYANLKATIDKFYNETSIQFIAKGVTDSEWESYLKKLDSINFERWVELNQMIYDAYVKAMK